MKRRQFLGLVGLGAASVPLAAKAALEAPKDTPPAPAEVIPEPRIEKPPWAEMGVFEPPPNQRWRGTILSLGHFANDWEQVSLCLRWHVPTAMRLFKPLRLRISIDDPTEIFCRLQIDWKYQIAKAAPPLYEHFLPVERFLQDGVWDDIDMVVPGGQVILDIRNDPRRFIRGYAWLEGDSIDV